MAAPEQPLPLPPRASNSWQSAVQLNPIPPPLKKPSRLGKVLVENEEKVKNLMHEDQRRRRLSVLDTKEAGGDAQLKRPKSIGALAVKDKVPHLLRPPGALPYSYELTVSPGFDPEQKEGEPPKECQDEGIIVRTFCEDPMSTLVAVFDGHGVNGRKCAKFTATELVKTMENRYHMWLEDPGRYLTQAIHEVNATLLGPTSGINARFSGTTGCIVVIHDRILHIANVGDSRAVLVKAPPVYGAPVVTIELTKDHKPEDPIEQARIDAAGGRVGQQQYGPGEFDGPHRVFRKNTDYPGLAMSRSIGDGEAESVGVISTPDISRVPIAPDDLCLIIASDGLWEVFTSQEAAMWLVAYESVRENLLRMPSTQALAEEAQRRWVKIDEGSCVVDDTTVLLVRLV